MWAGARGEAVKALQAAMTYCGSRPLNDGTPDGIWGPKTTAALREAQRVGRVTVDGEYGPQTHNAMSWSATLASRGGHPDCHMAWPL
ncbi:MAG: peptidoglycan-binding protein [Propionibacteriaceae bacterium]|nr:peptidoglycan-binding protein [Propionibacteriaceae bacterium]